MAISCHLANCCCRAAAATPHNSSSTHTHTHTDQHTHVPLADRSLNKITFKFNCKCILSVGFLLLLLVLALDSPSLLTAIMLHIFLWQCPTPASPSRRPRRWPFTIKCNYFCNIHLQLPLLLLLLLLLLDVAGVAATSCLAYFRLPQRPGDRVIKVNLVTIYRHICFCCRCCCRCSCKLQVASCTWAGPNDPVVICCRCSFFKFC